MRRPGPRLFVLLLLDALAVGAARIARPGRAHPVRVSPALTCGSERWLVMTLQDRPRLFAGRTTTVGHLASLPRPSPFPTTRTAFERRIYSVVAAVTPVRSEADKDLHVVLKSGAKHMIAESPMAARLYG